VSTKMGLSPFGQLFWLTKRGYSTKDTKGLRLSVISYQLSVISYQLSVVSYQIKHVVASNHPTFLAAVVWYVISGIAVVQQKKGFYKFVGRGREQWLVVRG
jgi:hypothetical protein